MTSQSEPHWEPGRGDGNSPQFQFSITWLLFITFCLSILFAAARMLASSFGMSQVQFSLALGIAFAPAGFALVLIGMCTLAFRPRAKWAIRMVNLGGMMMAALLPAILIGIVTYEILSN